MITRKELIKKYIDFFKSKGHKEIQNASLIPENDPTVLFTTAGMHPLVPYLLGQKHPLGKKLVNMQKCIRTGDIDEVGDTTHHTFFEMLGNWSLGNYFKKEAIEWSFEFLTKILKIPKEKLLVTCFKGDKNAPKDTEAEKIWKSLGIKKIKFLGKEDNWWGPAGNTGPCGPDTEMFVNDVEIWNDVFMQYEKDSKGNYNHAKQKNIDTGMGVERALALLQRKKDNYLTEVWKPLIQEIEKLSEKKYGKNKQDTKSMRIIADHIKASVFILAEGITPSNTEHGYVLRRLIRRAILHGKKLGIAKEKDITTPLTKQIIKIYSDYPELKKQEKFIIDELNKEEDKFEQTLQQGIDKFEKISRLSNSKFLQHKGEREGRAISRDKISETKIKSSSEVGSRVGKTKQIGESKNFAKKTISGKECFLLYQSFGFPIEMTKEMADERGIKIDEKGFEQECQKHQELSRTASAGKFKSGLADQSEKTTKLHTATHLLLQALKIILDDKNIIQKGSNITSERLRFDFSFPRKLTKDELKKIEDLVNAEIQNSCEVTRQEMSLKQAKQKGATGTFNKKYGNKVSVYTIGNFSKEICAGPHVKNTCELGHFKIKKEESSSSGVRRIKAVLE